MQPYAALPAPAHFIHHIPLLHGIPLILLNHLPRKLIGHLLPQLGQPVSLLRGGAGAVGEQRQ